MENMYETFASIVCKNCKNKENCNEELRRKIDNSIKCERYEGSEIEQKTHNI